MSEVEPQNAIATAWGAFVARRRWWVLAAWVLLAGGLAYYSVQTPRLLSPTGFTTDTEASRAGDVLRDRFPERTGPVLNVVFHSDAVPVSDPAYQRQVAAWRADLDALAGAGATVAPTPPGKDGRTVALVLASNENPDNFIHLAHRARDIHHDGPATVYLGGIGAVYDSFVADSEQDLQNSEKTSLPLAIFLLLVVFGGLVAAGLPVVTGLATVTVAVALLGFLARLHTVSVFSLNVTSVVGIGLGIDYSLLVVNRFREELRQGRSVEEAVAGTVGTAGLATVISGGTAMIGFGALLLSHLNVLWSIGLGGSLVVGVSVVASLSLIPALLGVFGSRVDRLALPFLRGRDTSGFWHRLAGGVMRRPFLFIAATLAVVLVLGWPARHIDPGVVGAESLPPGDAAYRADQLGREQHGFPAYSPILVVAQGVNTFAQAGRLEEQLNGVAGKQLVRGPGSVPPEAAPLYFRPPYAVYEVDQPAADNDHRTREFLDHLRNQPWPSGVSVRLSGEAPGYQDFLKLLYSDFPRVIGAVVAMTLLLLGLAFRSLALPLKAVLMNLLSVGAAMGVLTFVFQEGHFAGQLNFRSVGFVDATIPMIIFAGLFGLSMDYEVFLLSRIREEYLRTGDNARAVALGMEKTGQIITSAALVLVLVSMTLAFSQLVINKSIGVTFALAILLDATVIRLLLVPAMMRVLGNLNWWPGRRKKAGRLVVGLET